MDNLKHFLYDYLINQGLSEATAKYVNMAVLLILLLLVVGLIDYVTRRILRGLFSRIANRSKSDFDDIMIQNKMPRNLAHIVPLLLLIEFVPMVFSDFPYLMEVSSKGLQILGIFITLWVAKSLLSTFKDYFKSLENFKDKPIDSYIQVFMIFSWAVGLFSIFAIIADITLTKFLTGLGAVSAVIILVFRDTILGFVASLQVSINDMVRIGDWITFEKFGADGDVIEINLATVKVQNWDKTITTIPTYALISDSFKNWRGMTESGGRRIKRFLSIKIDSINYLTLNQIDKLKKISLISEYLITRQAEVDKHNSTNNIDKSLLINGRNLTNLGVFRKYVLSYIENHSGINKDMTIMVRQLAPSAQGIPLEIYAFSTDKRWANYEYIMADIFDHVIAAVPYFDLEIFELPNSGNFNSVKDI